MNDSNSPLINPVTDAPDITAYQPPAPVVAPSAPTPPAMVPSPVTSPENLTPKVNQENLEAQNIFDLLGVSDGTDSDKEAFLDELQQVIWQDFLENDLQLLLTKEELKQVRDMQTQNSDLAKQQEEIVGFLENLIPDLEDIMLEKALELKRDMVKERLGGLREYLAGQTDKLTQVQSAEDLIKQNKWASAAGVLNKI